MAADPKLPRAQTSVDQQGGLITPEWYRFFQQLLLAAQEAGILPGVIEDILARLEELEQNGNTFLLQGLLSVEVFGTPESGLVSLQLIGDVDAPGNTYYYGTGPTGTKGWFAVADALTNGDGIDLNVGLDGVTEISFNADTAEVAHLPGATYKTVQKVIDVMLSPGIITGGEVTELTSTSVRITGGTAVVRIADDNVSELRFFDFPSQDFSVPDVQVTHFYALDYNGGSPVMVESLSSESWDRDTEIPLGSAVRGDGFLSVTPNPYRTGDVITNLIQRLDAIGPVQRDNSVGGLALGETGTRNVTVSAGRLWSRVSDFNIAAKNSSVEPMSTVFFNGTNLTVTSGITQWDNQNYNDLGTGALVPLGNNKWANLWFFMSFNGDHYGFAYGTGEHNSLGDAANEGVPSYLTQNFFNQFILLGRFIFQESAATAGSIESAFESVFNVQAVNTHNDLGGLQGGTVGEFYHFTNAEHTFLASVGSDATFDERAQDAVGNNLLDTATVNLTYNDATGQISADVISANLGGGAGTTAQFLRGDGAWSSILTGTLNWTLDSPAQMFGIASRYGNDAVPPQLSFQKARGTSSVPAAVQSGDQLLEFQARGYHSGGAFSGNVGGFRMVAIDNFTSTAQGTRFILRSANAGSTTVATVFESDSNRSWQPGSDNQQDIGAASTRMRTLYAGTGAINTSDEREKDELLPLTIQEISASVELAREIGTYRWLSSIEAKGDQARRHIGITVQRAIEIMQAHGLDPFRYAFICYDKWEARPEVWSEWADELDEDGVVVREAGRELVQEAREAGDRYSFRHDQLLLFISRGQQQAIDSQEQRIAALEALISI